MAAGFCALEWVLNKGGGAIRQFSLLRLGHRSLRHGAKLQHKKTMIRSFCSVLAAVSLAWVSATTVASAVPSAPPGFTALFNGQNLSGWWGEQTTNPRTYLALTPEALAQRKAASQADIAQHWRVENGELVNDGKGLYLTTDKFYGNFELLIDYKTVPQADSGIYLRGCPQVQIWDYTDPAKFKIGADKGSGGLWNNSPGSAGKDPLVKADKPFGEWNQFRIVMVGSRVWVWLNGQATVEGAIMENYYDRKQPLPPTGPIQLQTHGGEIRWRNIFIREIPPAEATRWLRPEDAPGFEPVFNGKDFSGWAGPVENYEVQDEAIVCKPGKGGTIYTQREYGDFVARLEFKVPAGGNNGLAIRYPGRGDAAYAGMCELQVLDDNYEKARNAKIDPRQAHGSAYGTVAAHCGYQHPVGEWNYQEVTVKGSTLKVELNGTVILDTDLANVTEFMANTPHPGKDLKRGHFGFAGHSDPVMFRKVSIKSLN